MKLIELTVIIFAILISYSCNKEEDEIVCEKITHLDEAIELMNLIYNNRITDSLTIINNLIGEWKFIGAFSSFEKELGEECITLEIGSNTIEVRSSDSGSATLTNWELMPFEKNGNIEYILNSNEETPLKRNGMVVFSDNIMYGDGRILDAPTYIYEKVK